MALVSHSEIFGGPTHADWLPGDPQNTWRYDPGFYARLEVWAAYWVNHTPVSWLTPLRFHGYGAYTDKPGMHGLGRAVDISRIYVTLNGSSFLAADAHYDLWRSTSAAASKRRLYWGTAASLFRHFQYVLTYEHGSSHWNHFHIDTQISGNADSSFSSSSTTQVDFLQSSLKYVWGYSAVSVDGVYGPQTRDYVSRALDRSGSPGAVTNFANW